MNITVEHNPPNDFYGIRGLTTGHWFEGHQKHRGVVLMYKNAAEEITFIMNGSRGCGTQILTLMENQAVDHAITKLIAYIKRVPRNATIRLQV